MKDINANIQYIKLLKEIIQNEDIRTVFQPIVSLQNGEILGYEALSRGPAGSLLESPDLLFKVAAANNMLWDLEYLCRLKALERARKILDNKMLFINVDPNIINDEKFRVGFTREYVKKFNIDAANIIFEITERTSIEDFKSFRKVIDNYISQGYKIAVDDTGAGYSGLRMLAEIHPQYIKIDMELIRDIDKKVINQALIKTLNDFAYATNMKIIAEGIETVDELNLLIDFGIEYGQGYLLQRPAPEFLELSPPVKELIINKQHQKQKRYYYTQNSMPIGEIARFDSPINSTATGSIVNEIFNVNPQLSGIAVVDNGIPTGLIMKSNFYSCLATQYGLAVFMNRPIKLLMNKNPLIVDYETTLAQVSKIAIGRRTEDLYDYIIITKGGNYFGVTTVKSLLEYTTQLELNKAKHANPLTGLPGNIVIEEKLRSILDTTEDCFVMYFDLDNFKPYNDVYGFENGDKIIINTANIIQESFNTLYLSESFLGHIGGDDLVAIIFADSIDDLCKMIIEKFDTRVKNFYTEYDIRNGFIKAGNRHGVVEKFPMLSISLAAVDIRRHKFKDTLELTELLGEIKKKCKLEWNSNYCIV